MDSINSDLNYAYSLMPPVSKSRFPCRILQRVDNKWDARSIAAGLTLLAGVVSWSVSTTYILYKLINKLSISDVYHHHFGISLSITVIVCETIAILIIAAVRRAAFLRRLLNADRQREFVIKHHTLLCLVTSPEEIGYYHRYIVSSRKQGVAKFSMTFTWSGSGTLTPVLRNPRFAYVVRPSGRAAQMEIEITFPQPLEKGWEEKIEFALLGDTREGTNAEPYVALSLPSPKFPRWQTFLVAAFAANLSVATVRRKKHFSPLLDRALSSKVMDLDSQHRHVWQVRRRVGWRYSINWEYGV